MFLYRLDGSDAGRNGQLAANGTREGTSGHGAALRELSRARPTWDSGSTTAPRLGPLACWHMSPGDGRHGEMGEGRAHERRAPRVATGGKREGGTGWASPYQLLKPLWRQPEVEVPCTCTAKAILGAVPPRNIKNNNNRQLTTAL